jgi:hypothetical protein
VKKRLLLATTIAAICATGAANAQLELNASLELDTDTYDTADTERKYDQNGHVELGAMGMTTHGDYFAKAVGVVRLQTDGDDNVEVRDVYFQIGNSTWDAMFGRFEAVNLFPLGKDTVVTTAGGVSFYEANLVRGRSKDDGGQIAFHYNPTETIRFELASIFGDDDTAGDNGTAISGIRPAISFSYPNIRVTAGMEKVKYDLTGGGEVDKTGFGINTGINLGEGFVNLAVSRLNNDETDLSTTSFAANMTYGAFGLGYIHSNEEVDGDDDMKLDTIYAAYTVQIFDMENASVTFAGSMSKAKNAGSDDKSNALRVRFNYAF